MTAGELLAANIRYTLTRLDRELQAARGEVERLRALPAVQPQVGDAAPTPDPVAAAAGVLLAAWKDGRLSDAAMKAFHGGYPILALHAIATPKDAP